MLRKMKNGQRVKIIEVRDKRGQLKYPQIEEYVNQTGVIVRGFDHRMSKRGEIEPFPCHVVLLDSGTKTKLPMPEDALVVLDK